MADPPSQRRDRFGRGGGGGKARHPPLHKAAGDLVSPSAAGLDLDRPRDGAARDPSRAWPLTRAFLPPEAGTGNGEPGGEHPPRRTYLHLEVEVSEQYEPRVDAAREEVEHCLADRGHHGGGD